MSVARRTQWTQQLEAAEFDPSWKAEVEKRVLRFLLSRYGGSREAQELGEFPFFEAPSPVGRARVSPTHYQLKWRLEHIARVVRECQMDCVYVSWGLVEFRIPVQRTRSDFPDMDDTIQELEEFVACRLEHETEAQYQEAIRARRW